MESAVNEQGNDGGSVTVVLPMRHGTWPVGELARPWPPGLTFRDVERLHDPARRTHIVYFIYCAGFVKIGITTNLEKRMATLQIGAPWQARVVGMMVGGRTTESFLHFVFSEHSVGGEWFRLSDEIRQALAIIAVPELSGHLEVEETEYREWIREEAQRLGV